MAAEKFVPVHAAPEPEAVPSTLIVTVCADSLQVPVTAKLVESFAALMKLAVAGAVIATVGAEASRVTLTEPEVVALPAASAIIAVIECPPALRAVELIDPENVAPVQVAPAPLAVPSTLIVTCCEDSLQVPETL